MLAIGKNKNNNNFLKNNCPRFYSCRNKIVFVKLFIKLHYLSTFI